MAEFSHGNLPSFPFLMIFSVMMMQMRNFLRCQRRSLPTWEAKTKPKQLGVQKLGWMFSTSKKCSVARRESWKISLVMSWMQFFVVFFCWNSKKGRSRIPTRKCGCHAVLVGPSFEKLWRKLQYLGDREFAKLGNNLKRKQEDYDRRVTESEKLLFML